MALFYISKWCSIYATFHMTVNKRNRYLMNVEATVEFIFLLFDGFMVESTLWISSNLLNFPDIVFE